MNNTANIVRVGSIPICASRVNMYLSIIAIPLISAISTLLFGRYLGKKGAAVLTTSALGITALISLFIFYEVGLSGSPVYIKAWSWMDSGLLTIDMGFMFDSVTASMLILVTIVSAFVHLYSTEYMGEDPHLPRFMSYLSLFTFFMLILVTADNFVQLFIGWEGVGLCSYLLINYWYTRIQANKSAMKAMIVNRVGDIGLALAMFAIYNTFKSLDFATVFSLAHTMQDKTFIFINWPVNSLTVICLLLLVGAVGKSAQLGLHTWLPDAMEGPTPVSALIHAATMVTAGVFLLIRCSPILEYAPMALMVVVIIGALTAFFAATVGLVQNDIKKVIAYSTCSQLGYMVFACGISNYSTSLFHLVNHGFFVRWHRYIDLYDGLSFRDQLKGGKSTCLFSKFKLLVWGKKGEREWTPVQNYVIVIWKKFNLFVKSIQEKIDESLQYLSWRRIGSPLTLSISTIYILKASKPVSIIQEVNNILLPVILILLLLIFFQVVTTQSGCRISYQANALGNARDTLLLTRPRGRWISYSFVNFTLTNTFFSPFSLHNPYLNKQSIKENLNQICLIHSSFDSIKTKIDEQLPNWLILLGGSNTSNNRWLRNIIHNKLWWWAQKKHRRVRKDIIFNLYFNPFWLSIPHYSFPLTKFIKGSQFDNIHLNLDHIKYFISSLDKPSGIYMIFMTRKPAHLFIGSSTHLWSSLQAHSFLSKPYPFPNRHPNLSLNILKYGLGAYSYRIIEVCSIQNLLEREQYWLDIAFDDVYISKHIFNLLRKTNSA